MRQTSNTRLLTAALAVVQATINASPTLLPQANDVRPAQAIITEAPQALVSGQHRGSRRDILSDIEGDVDSILSGLGSNIPTYVASGVVPWFQGLPTSDAVISSLGLDSSQVQSLPTQVLNIDPYANYTGKGWNVRFHGNVYKQPQVSNATLDKLANDLFIYGTQLASLPESEQSMARNLTAEIFVIQQGDVNVSTISIEPSSGQGSSGEPGGGGGASASGGSQQITLPYPTTPEGDFDVFVPIASHDLQPGNSTSKIQRLDLHIAGASLGNATAYLVPSQGLTVVSDIDDILRVTKIYDPEQGLLDTFARPFTPWENMPDIYANWSRSLPNMHFHYLTTTPEQVTRNYMQFIYANYPGGSFDTRPLNFTNVEETLSVRKYLLVKIFETFPDRKFILIADTSNSDVMRDYPQMAHDYPNQVQCIWLRNTTATDPTDKFPYDTSGFKGIDQSKYMFFLNANDLAHLDFSNGQCYNQSIAQNLTFGYQGLPDGLGHTTSTNGSAAGASMATVAVSSNLAFLFTMMLGVMLLVVL